jgi:hypothetical protein
LVRVRRSREREGDGSGVRVGVGGEAEEREKEGRKECGERKEAAIFWVCFAATSLAHVALPSFL